MPGLAAGAVFEPQPMSRAPLTFSPREAAPKRRREPMSRGTGVARDSAVISPQVVRSADNAAAAAAPTVGVMMPSLAMLLAGHILRDGEVVLLILKPSRWSIVLSSLPFFALLTIGAIAGNLCLEPRNQHLVIEVIALAVAARIMWATLLWMSRLYIMTDYRILRLSGVLSVDVFDCPLRKVRQTRLLYSLRERLWSLGSIEIQPADSLSDPRPPGIWQSVRRPADVHDRIRSAIAKAKSGGAA
jgi:hypothetical protein